MGALWFALVVLVLTTFVVLDGFDLGVGIVYLLVAKGDDERRIALNAIGPVWSGNEVWLVIGGGVLFLSFPKVYAASLSGFYLGLFLMLWLLIGRGLSLELRSQLDSPVWRTFWDTAFSASSLALAGVLGVVLGNLLRGVPLNAQGFFFAPLWTNWQPGVDAGLLDWYTVLVGLLSVTTLAVYGATYLSMKANGAVRDRAIRLVSIGWWAVVVVGLLSVAASLWVQPLVVRRYGARLPGLVLPLISALGLAGVPALARRAKYGAAFLSLAVFIGGLLGSVALALFPDLLIATTDPAHSLTIDNAAVETESLRAALVWFVVALVLVLAYSVYSYRSFRGRVTHSSIEEGY